MPRAQEGLAQLLERAAHATEGGKDLRHLDLLGDVDANCFHGCSHNRTEGTPRIARIAEVGEALLLVGVAVIKLVGSLQIFEPPANLAPQRLGANVDDDQTGAALSGMPLPDLRLDPSPPLLEPRLAIAHGVVKVETHAALEMRRFWSCKLRAENAALRHDEPEEVLDNGARLALVQLEEQVCVQCDDARPHLTAERAQQEDVAQLNHRAATNQTRKGADFVEYDNIEALPLDVVERLEAAEHILTGGEVDVRRHVAASHNSGESLCSQRLCQGLLLSRGACRIHAVGCKQQKAGGGIVLNQRPRLAGDCVALEVANHC